MSENKIIAIVGATGNQGSSVAKAFLSTPGWTVRCLIRNPASEKAQALLRLGAHIRQANLDSIDSLAAAFDGVDVIFANTDFWEIWISMVNSGTDQNTASSTAYTRELTWAKNAAIAASRVPTLKGFVYSALAPMKDASGGKYTTSLHWESKADTVKFIEKELPELWKKTSLIYVGTYSTNPFLIPKKDPESGEYVMALPTVKTCRFPIINTPTSVGPFVRELVLTEDPGTKLLAFDRDSYLTAAEALQLWSKITGKPAKYVQLGMKEMAEKTGLPMEMLGDAGFLGEFSFTHGVESVITPDQLKNKVETSTYEDYLKARSLEYLLEGGFSPF
ncbi:putative -like family protein [Phaeoacremonium minimum UCRPA7]|uniref:Putative-like family protein n=1 Tax=Phaeoacremonium minimum (strain UCR-PA7) TaxID=1286976 RepID=R8BVF6_PHAM7|nr:putative -like family protein [Phaeoacremonium minimum UCRPA7]EOO03338.1 putative -like family protein [Phaeoacremonium minimum UCRPA7]